MASSKMGWLNQGVDAVRLPLFSIAELMAIIALVALDCLALRAMQPRLTTPYRSVSSNQTENGRKNLAAARSQVGHSHADALAGRLFRPPMGTNLASRSGKVQCRAEWCRPT